MDGREEGRRKQSLAAGLGGAGGQHQNSCLRMLGLEHLMDFQVETEPRAQGRPQGWRHLGVVGLGHAEPQACVCSPGNL